MSFLGTQSLSFASLSFAKFENLMTHLAELIFKTSQNPNKLLVLLKAINTQSKVLYNIEIDSKLSPSKKTPKILYLKETLHTINFLSPALLKYLLIGTPKAA
jgi:hypothetical protein